MPANISIPMTEAEPRYTANPPVLS